MAHVKLGTGNDADSQTVISAHGAFISFSSVFAANGNTSSVANRLTGLEGQGNNGGAGVIGQGGKPWQTMELRVAGAGVVGRGGPVDGNDFPGLPGPGVVGLGTDIRDPDPRDSAGAGVFGAGLPGVYGQASAGTQNQKGPEIGVVGLSGPSIFLLNPPRSGTGVYGAADRGVGVLGFSGGAIEPGVRGEAGVVGISGNGPGGSFESSQWAQIHLTPSSETTLPTRGVRGDLWAHVGKNSPKRTEFRQGEVSLYLCVEDFPDVRWQKVLLDTPKLKGGTPVP